MRHLSIVIVVLALSLTVGSALAQDFPAQGGISVGQAQDIALNLYPGTAVVLAEITFENGAQAWDIKLNNGIAVYINASTGAVLEIEPWQNNLHQGMPRGSGQPGINAPPMNIGADGIDFEEARTIALNLYPNTTVVEAEFEVKRGAQVWDIKLSNSMAVYINAGTGQIIEVEPWGRGGRWRDEGRSDRQGPPPWAGFPGGRRAWEAQQLSSVPAAPVAPANGGAVQPIADLSLQQAVEIARAQFPDAQLVEAELTYWDNRAPAWDIKLSNGQAVYVDAQTGAVLEIEPYR